MTSWKSYIFILWGITIILFIAGCSPSSYSSRYKKPQKEEDDSNNESVRFTSQNDTQPEKEGKTTEYPNIPEEFDVPPKEEYPVDISSLMEKHHHLKKMSGFLTSREKMLFEILNYIDTPYKYGGDDKEGIDCSAFTQNVFSTTTEMVIPRTAREQYSTGDRIQSHQNLLFGDLIFFDTTSGSYPGHVGIYLGDDLFAHSSRSKGVTISSLQSEYYMSRFVGGRRVKKFE